MTNKNTFRQSHLLVLAFCVLTLTLGVTSVVNAQSPAVMPEGIPAACLSISNTLRFGSTDALTGGEVTKLQEYVGVVPVTGYFGPLTQAAVQQWQTLNEIVMSGTPETTGYGVVGLRSRAAFAAGCVGAQESVVNDAFAPQADFYFDTAQMPLVSRSDDTRTMTLRGTAKNVREMVLVNIDNTSQSAAVTYDPLTDTYTGTVTLDESLTSAVADCPCVYEIKLGSQGGAVVHWEQAVAVIHGGEHHFALFDADSKQLLDYIVFSPKTVVSVNTNDDGVLSNARINGEAEVDELVVRVTEKNGDGAETVYVSEPVDVKNGRWWHRITAPLSAQVYSIFLETPDGTPLFEGTYEPE